LTVSRSAVLAVLAVAFVLLPTWPKVERRIAYVVIALGVAGLWMLVPGLAGTFRTLFATLSGDSSTTSRTSAFSTAMPYISQHPWFGHGFGTFFPATYFFTDDQYLLSLIEIGVVGLFALLALFVTGLVTAQRVRRATKDPEMRDLGQSLTATITVAMVASAPSMPCRSTWRPAQLLAPGTGAALRRFSARRAIVWAAGRADDAAGPEPPVPRPAPATRRGAAVCGRRTRWRVCVPGGRPTCTELPDGASLPRSRQRAGQRTASHRPTSNRNALY
jgi:hypothetical protein